MKVFRVGLLLFAAVACAPAPNGPTSTPVQLVPFLTSTPPQPVPLPPQVTSTGDRPVPSPTPFSYTVQAGDTLSGIAGRFHVSLDELRAANPDVPASAMAIGTVLHIPSSPASPGPEGTPTPVPVDIHQQSCYPSADSGLWCFILVHNPGPEVMENVAAQVTLHNASGEEISSQSAFLPLDILPPGASIPLTAYFPGQVVTEGVPGARILSAMLVAPESERYVAAELRGLHVEMHWTGTSAQVEGEVYLPEGTTAASRIWVAATAFDVDGHAVGVRRWESTEPLVPGASVRFRFSISSLAGEIDHVELAVEATP